MATPTQTACATAPWSEQREDLFPKTYCRTEYVRRVLELDDDSTYHDFYAFVERLMERQGILGRSLRSVSEKEIAPAYMFRGKNVPDHLRPAVKLVESRTGQRAFRGIVVRISSNFRRRTKTQYTRRKSNGDYGNCAYGNISDTSQHNEALATRGSISSPSTAPSASMEELWDGIFSVILRDGLVKPVCRSCELMRDWPQQTNIYGSSLEDLDFEKFLSILEDDHQFDRSHDTIRWEGDPEGSGVQCLVVENERQWKAVIALVLKLTRGRPLSITFTVTRGRTRLSQKIRSR